MNHEKDEDDNSQIGSEGMAGETFEEVDLSIAGSNFNLNERGSCKIMTGRVSSYMRRLDLAASRIEEEPPEGL